MYRVISITRWGETIDLSKYNINFVGKDFVFATPKGCGFMTRFDKSNCYTVITEKI